MDSARRDLLENDQLYTGVLRSRALKRIPMARPRVAFTGTESIGGSLGFRGGFGV